MIIAIPKYVYYITIVRFLFNIQKLREFNGTLSVHYVFVSDTLNAPNRAIKMGYQ